MDSWIFHSWIDPPTPSPWTDWIPIPIPSCRSLPFLWSPLAFFLQDNVLGPLVASFGDLLAILLLVSVATILSLFPSGLLLIFLVGLFVFMPPFFYSLARRVRGIPRGFFIQFKIESHPLAAAAAASSSVYRSTRRPSKCFQMVGDPCLWDLCSAGLVLDFCFFDVRARVPNLLLQHRRLFPGGRTAVTGWRDFHLHSPNKWYWG